MKHVVMMRKKPTVISFCYEDLGLIHSVFFYYRDVLLSVLMLDEAHERTLYTDIAIGLLKKVIPADSVSETNKT